MNKIASPILLLILDLFLWLKDLALHEKAEN
jgi:hypothetical protein